MVSKKDRIIRVGDRVRILRPRIIKRWGYDNNLQDVVDEVLYNHKHTIEEFIHSLVHNRPLINCATRVSNKAIQKVAFGLAYEIVHDRMRTGNVRKLFYKDGEEDFIVLNHQEGQIAEVSAVKIVQTGVYYPPTHSDDGWGSYVDCPGGLSDIKTHKLLQLNWTNDWIEACDVEKIHDRPKTD